MAALCRNLVRLNACRSAISVARRSFADKMMADPLEHATGIEKREILAIQAGDDDPFAMRVVKRVAGTKENPTLIPSAFEARIVGCICEEHAASVTWMWLHKGHPRRCECGHWYKLVEKQCV